MQITVSGLVDKTLQLRYDTEAQLAFSKAYPIAKAAYFDPNVQDIGAKKSKSVLAAMSMGCDLLRKLAEDSTRQLNLDENELRASLMLALFAAEFSVITGEPPSTLPTVIVLLAGVTPYPVSAVDLPPAMEVFNPDIVSSAVGEAFEYLRVWEGTEQPRLPLLQIYQLWFELEKIQPTNKQLQLLLRSLSRTTEMFRSSMNALASSELPPYAKKTSKRRKV